MMICKSRFGTVPFKASGSLFAAVAVAALLSGCVTTGAGCPAQKSYTRAQMTAAANELAKLPVGSELTAMVADYGQLRKACRSLGTNTPAN
jgi:hypothetical protein